MIPEAPGFDMFNWFPALFVLVVLIGIGTAIFRVYLARNMADKSGMDKNDASAVALLEEHGLTATYLASNMRPGPQGDQPDTRTIAERLAELQELFDGNLISQSEYEEVRRLILGSI